MAFTRNDNSSEYEERRKRRIDDDSEERGERRTKRPYIGTKPLLKVLVPDYVAGALIGKGGTVLKEMTSLYGGFLRLSSGREYYPGTEERIIVITGQVNQIIDLNNHIMEKVHDPGRDSTMKSIEIDPRRAEMVKIILTDGAAGLLIGKGGLTIKAIQEESKAKVSVAMPDKAIVSGERLLRIRGSLDERTLACKMVIEKVANDPSNMANTKTKYVDPPPPLRGAGLDVIPLAYDVLNALDKYDAPSRHYDTPSRRYDDPPSRRYDDAPSRRYDDPPSPRGNYNRSKEIKLPVAVTAVVDVPVHMVGAILGKQGSVIKDIVRRSAGARLKFEDQKEGEGETQKLTITGSMEQTQLAYALVNDRANSYDQNLPMR